MAACHRWMIDVFRIWNEFHNFPTHCRQGRSHPNYYLLGFSASPKFPPSIFQAPSEIMKNPQAPPRSAGNRGTARGPPGNRQETAREPPGRRQGIAREPPGQRQIIGGGQENARESPGNRQGAAWGPPGPRGPKPRKFREIPNPRFRGARRVGFRVFTIVIDNH